MPSFVEGPGRYAIVTAHLPEYQLGHHNVEMHDIGVILRVSAGELALVAGQLAW